MIRMDILSFIASLVFAGYFFLGFSVLSIEPGAGLNKIFFFISIPLMIWSFSAAFTYSAGTLEEVRFWYRLGLIGLLPYFPMVLHFCLLFTRKAAVWSMASVLPFLPLPFFMWMGASGTLYHGEFMHTADGWFFVPAFGSLNFGLYVAYYCLCFGSSAVLLALNIRKASLKNERIQSAILLVSLVLASLLSAGEEAILPSLTGYRSHGLSPLLNMVWPLGVWFAITYFRLMKIPYLQLFEQLFSRIEKSLFILDRDGRIVSANSSAEKLLGLSRLEKNPPFISVLEKPEEALRAMSFLKNDRKPTSLSFNAELSGRRNPGEGPCEVRLELLCDENGDALGFFAGIDTSSDDSSLIKMYGLTGRENEVAGYLIAGWSNREIASSLGVTERTVKAHLSSIYKKLSVTNRVGVLTLLRERETGVTVPEYNTNG